MKIGIPVWGDKVSPLFDTASRLLIQEVEDGREVGRFEVYLDEQSFHRRCSQIEALGVKILLCGAISRCFFDLLKASGIKVVPWICGPSEEVLDAYNNGSVLHPRFAMPGRK